MSGLRLAVNLDEVADDPSVAAAFLAKRGVRLAELRSVEGSNAVNLSQDAAEELRASLEAQGLQVCALASPLFKWPRDVSSPVPEHDSFHFRLPTTEEEAALCITRVLDRAVQFGARIVRTFSYLRVAGSPDRLPIGDELFEHALGEADRRGLALCLENEPVCTVWRVRDYLAMLEHYAPAGLRAWIDPANVVVSGERLDAGAVRAMGAFAEYVHVKDVQTSPSVRFVPAGAGEIDWRWVVDTLQDGGAQELVLSIETHVQSDRMAATGRAIEGLRRAVPEVR